MVNIALGLLLGTLFGFILFGIGTLIGDCVNYRYDDIVKIICFVLLFVSIIGGGVLGHLVTKHTSKSYVYEYEVVKDTIESSVNNDSLSGFEKAELVKQAAEENKKLAKYQYDANQWYGFGITDEVLELEPIELNGNE